MPPVNLGAGSLLAPDVAFTLGPSWAYQPKVDGCYAEAHLDSAGQVAEVLSRTGQPIAEGADLHGIVAGPAFSVLVGELEASTEAGSRVAAARGHRCIHLFDALRLGTTPIAGLPYVERWGALHRAQSLVESAGHRDGWERDATGRRHYAAGRYVAVPRDLRRLPIVPLLRSPADARELWRDVEAGTLEGLVAVRLDAPAGKRGGKRKIKIVDTLDAAVLATDGRVLRLLSPGGVEFLLASRLAATVRPGQVVEVAHHGWYESGSAPRFGRVRELREGAEVVRVRFDKPAPVAVVAVAPAVAVAEPHRPTAAERAAIAWGADRGAR